jgi:hypothetical protein
VASGPSDTSLQDAAAQAVARLWEEWQVWSALIGDVWSDLTVSHLCAVAWRAAFHSFNHDASEGRTGRKASQTPDAASVPLDGAQLAVERAPLIQWAQDRCGRMFTKPEEQAERAARCFPPLARSLCTATHRASIPPQRTRAGAFTGPSSLL